MIGQYGHFDQSYRLRCESIPLGMPVYPPPVYSPPSDSRRWAENHIFFCRVHTIVGIVCDVCLVIESSDVRRISLACTMTSASSSITGLAANTTRWNNDVLMLAQRLRRWPSIKTSLLQRVVFAWLTVAGGPRPPGCCADTGVVGPAFSQCWGMVFVLKKILP